MTNLVEFEYTIEEGGEWHAARGGLAGGQIWSSSPDQLEEKLEQWAEQAEPHVKSSRRVWILIDGGNMVPAAAVRLPNDRVLDAILGCFRDDQAALDKLRGRTVQDALSEATRAKVDAIVAASEQVQDHLQGEAPDPIPTDAPEFILSPHNE